MSNSSNDACTSRFDFILTPSPNAPQTATIRELLAEINLEHAPANGTEAKLDSLEQTLSFVGQLTGRRYTSISESLPVPLLRTVKLLYVENRDSNTHLIRFLSAPQHGARGTMEFRTGGSAPRNNSLVNVVKKLLTHLNLGISHRKLSQIETSLLTVIPRRLADARSGIFSYPFPRRFQ